MNSIDALRALVEATAPICENSYGDPVESAYDNARAVLAAHPRCKVCNDTGWNHGAQPGPGPGYKTIKCTFCPPVATHDAAGAREAWLSVDDAETKLWQAIQNIQFGNKTDDKLILAELRKLGVWLARFDAPPPPAAAKGVVVPDKKRVFQDDPYYASGWNACRAEVLRLNGDKSDA